MGCASIKNKENERSKKLVKIRTPDYGAELDEEQFYNLISFMTNCPDIRILSLEIKYDRLV